MQSSIVKVTGTPVSTYTTDATGTDIGIDDRDATGDRREYTQAHTEQTGSGSTSVLGPGDFTRLSVGRAGGTGHVTSTTVDATVDASQDCAAQHQYHVTERETGTMHALQVRIWCDLNKRPDFVDFC